MKTMFLLTLLAFGMITFSCSEDTSGKKDNNLLSTDIVSNPITADGEIDESKLPKFKFETLEYDFGAIIQGEKVSFTYNYENIGGSDLIIASAKASCGCTVAEWSKEPLPPGGKNTIEIVFDSSGKKGMTSKNITLMANTQPNKVELKFNAEIIVPSEK